MFVNLYAFLSLTREQWKPLLVMLTHTVVQCVLGKRDGEKNLPYIFFLKITTILKRILVTMDPQKSKIHSGSFYHSPCRFQPRCCQLQRSVFLGFQCCHTLLIWWQEGRFASDWKFQYRSVNTYLNISLS